MIDFLPESELGDLHRAARGVLSLPPHERRGAAHPALLGGLERAEAAAGRGEPWGEELARRYLELLGRCGAECPGDEPERAFTVEGWTGG